MPERENKRPEGALADVEELEETLRIVEQFSSDSPYLDNIHGYQELAELERVRDWAKEMEKHGHSISRIRLNLDESGEKDDPPDVLADFDGKPTGVEVTDLVEYPKQHAVCIATADGRVTSVRWKRRQNGRFDFQWHGADLGPGEKATWERKIRLAPGQYKGQGVEWTLERFQVRLREVVATKDDKAAAKRAKRMRKHGEDALDSRLHGNVLLIFTPEFYLQAHLAEYVEGTVVLGPENFDRVFLMGRRVPGERPRRHPLFEVRLVR